LKLDIEASLPTPAYKYDAENRFAHQGTSGYVTADGGEGLAGADGTGGSGGGGGTGYPEEFGAFILPEVRVVVAQAAGADRASLCF
jgi:hypothetical protein